jgi:hypothetical protein
MYDLALSGTRESEAFMHCRTILATAADELDRLEAALLLRARPAEAIEGHPI